MRRKLVQHGASTLITSLPRKWCEKFDLKKGDEINIEERGPLLEISTEKALVVRTQSLDIRKLSTSLIWRYILTLYRYGVDEIIITHDSQMDLIQEITNSLIGFGIVKQEEQKITIRDLSGVSETEFNTIYRRCFFLLLDMAERTLELHSKNQKLLPVSNLDKNLNKYVDYCLRVLNKRGFSDPRHTSLYYYTIIQIEYIGDIYSRIAKTNPKELKFLKEVNQLLRKFYELCFDYSNTKAQEIFDIRKQIEPKLKNHDLLEIIYTIINLIDSQYALSLT